MRVFNTSPGFGKPIAEDQISDFLTKNRVPLYLGTIDEKKRAKYTSRLVFL